MFCFFANVAWSWYKKEGTVTRDHIFKNNIVQFNELGCVGAGKGFVCENNTFYLSKGFYYLWAKNKNDFT